MSVTYSTNWMGPVSMKWFRDRGLTEIVSEVLEEDHKFSGLKKGQIFDFENITTHYACGRIDIRGLDPEKYWNGWDEYSLAPMHGEDWKALSDWLHKLKTETKLSYDELIERFETEIGHKIRWWVDNE